MGRGLHSDACFSTEKQDRLEQEARTGLEANVSWWRQVVRSQSIVKGSSKQ